MNWTSIMIYAVILVAAYVFLANRLLAVGSHFRARALDLGSQLLNDSRVPNDLKDSIENWLCDIPKTSFAWRLNLLIIPSIILVLIVRWSGKPLPKTGMPIVNSPYWKTWDDFTTMAIIATFCNSPIAFALGLLQFLFAVSFVRGNYVIWVTANRFIHRDNHPIASVENPAH